MDAEHWKRVKALLDGALECKGAERETFIDEACAGDPELRSELISLVRANEAAGEFLDTSPVSSDTWLHAALDERLERIDRYRILRRLGAGGMGVVYLAQEDAPIKRRVALKLIKRGMESRQILARFETERQALGLMNHPHVATVYDAGETDFGRPYFVMEYVDGVPITQYCDDQKLTTRERLELFRGVCDGVRHAHQKAIIHRDLKPSNILVTVEGGKPTPKIIDFGVAKATRQRLAEKTAFTELGMLIGTPEYMSPEQASGDGEMVDTRSDVYSLGVVLYELLVGALPLDSAELRRAGFDEIRRKVREDEPARPSTRLSTLGERASDVARCRRTDHHALIRELRGDLDWITMKALEKSRTRRYGSPVELTRDIERYLASEPVEARPPSRTYRAGKFVRRHRFGVAAATLAGLGLVGFAVSMALAARQISIERRAVEAAYQDLEQVTEFQSAMLAEMEMEQVGRRLLEDIEDRVDQSRASGAAGSAELIGQVLRKLNWTDMARRLVDEEILARAGATAMEDFDDQPLVSSRLQYVIGNTYFNLGLYDRASAHLESALESRRRVLGHDDPATLKTINELGILRVRQGRLDEADLYLEESLEARRRVLGSDDPETLITINNMGELRSAQGRWTEAEAHFREALEGRRRSLGNDHEDTLVSVSNLGFVLDAQGRSEEAEPYYLEALEGRRRVLGDVHPATLTSINNMAYLLFRQGKLDEAESRYRKVLDLRRRIQGDDHPDTLTAIHNLGSLFDHAGRYDDAEPLYLEALEGRRRQLGDHHSDTLLSISNMSLLLLDQGKLDEAEAYQTEALDLRRRTLGPDHPDTLTSINSMGSIHSQRGDFDAAETWFARALEARRTKLGDRHRDTLRSLKNLASVVEAGGRPEDSIALWVELIEIRRGLDEDHPETLFAIAKLGTVYNGLERFDEAAALLGPAMESARSSQGGNPAVTGVIASELGRCLLRLGRAAEAETALLEGYEVLETVAGSEHPRTRKTAAALVDLYEGQARTQKAEEWRARID